MGRLLFTVAITAVFVAVVAIVITRSVTRTGHDAATVSDQPHPEMLRLQVDGRTTPAVTVPGGRFHYHFRVTNIGDIALRNVAVRSEEMLGRTVPPRFQLLSVSDATCAADGTVSCLFPSLPPGSSRTVRVEAMAARPRVAVDQIMIQTFVGCYVPDSGGGVDFSVIGDGKETFGRLTVAAGDPGDLSAGSGRRPSPRSTGEPAAHAPAGAAGPPQRSAAGPERGRTSHGASTHGASTHVASTQGASSQGASTGAAQGRVRPISAWNAPVA